jgi:hypothetical protein
MVVVLLSTTGDILDQEQKAAFERYIRAGGGFVGIHSASDTEYHWPWYGRLIGTWFASHPQIQPATIRNEDANHPSTKDLRASWERVDEVQFPQQAAGHCPCLGEPRCVDLFRRRDGQRPPDCVVPECRWRPQLVHRNGAHGGILCRAAVSTSSVGWDRERRGHRQRLWPLT